jgi:hypothetical protein
VGRDALAEVCVLLSASLANEEALLALPLSMALGAFKHGNDALVTRVLAVMERLVPNGAFQRIALARGGLVMSALQGLLSWPSGHSRHSAQALKLLGKMTAQGVIFVKPALERGPVAAAARLLADTFDPKAAAVPDVAAAKRDALEFLAASRTEEALPGLIVRCPSAAAGAGTRADDVLQAGACWPWPPRRDDDGDSPPTSSRTRSGRGL